MSTCTHLGVDRVVAGHLVLPLEDEVEVEVDCQGLDGGGEGDVGIGDVCCVEEGLGGFAGAAECCLFVRRGGEGGRERKDGEEGVNWMHGSATARVVAGEMTVTRCQMNG